MKKLFLILAVLLSSLSAAADQIRIEGRLGPIEVPLSARLLSISKYFDKSELNNEMVMVLRLKYAKSSSHTKKYSYKQLNFPLVVGELQEQGDTLVYVSEGKSIPVATHKWWYYPYWMMNSNVRIDSQVETKSGTLFTYILDPVLIIE